MRNCLCCRVTTGSLLLGLLTLFSSILILIPLVGYYVDIPYFNFISNEKDLIYNIEGKSEFFPALIFSFLVLVTIKRHAWTRDHVEDIRRIIEESYPYAVLAGIAYTGATVLASFSLTVGVCAKVRKQIS